ncbi:MAG: SMP-30/gluconolactonase/LRE family protein [Puniceicoccales bacterium]|jgi:sugar lactone lactonase YvrE|nr:SMP-30/gluconolactonase/LRE family protein [Puniceicoccales bacterium]
MKLPLAALAAKLSVALLLALTLGACQSGVSNPKGRTTLLGGKLLPETFASPDGLTLGADGNIYVSITQHATNWKHPAKIARIGADDSISDFFVLPPNERSGRTMPMGLVFAGDGHLYVADNQGGMDKGMNGSSSLLRVVIENGKPLRAERVVEGINAANGVAVWKDHIYVSDPDLRVSGRNLSGVYRFAISELKAGAPVKVTGVGDPHLILTIETRNKAARGANGIAFDSEGHLYVNNFGDVEVLRYTLDSAGNIARTEVFARLREKGVSSVDGMHTDAEDNLWIADILGNAVLRLSTKTGRVTFLAQSKVPSDDANSADGALDKDGALDTPSECILRGDKLYVSNIDLPIKPSVGDATQTITVISLK